MFNAGMPLVTGAYPDKAPENQAFPFLVFSAQITGGPHAFQKDIGETLLDIHVYAKESADAAVSDPWLTISNIEERVMGDSSAGSVPSFGFHRYALVPGGSWSPCQAEWIATLPAPEDSDVLHYVQRFRIFASK